MTHAMLEDFLEDVAEGDLVTLLLSDKTQETGIVKKIRTTNIKIEIINSNTTVIINFEDIQRYALGDYTFVDRKNGIATYNQPVAISRPIPLDHNPGNGLQNSGHTASIDMQVKLINEQIKSECLYATLTKEIHPVFDFEIKSTSYTVQTQIKKFRSTMKNKYESAVRLKELSRVQSSIQELKKFSEEYPREEGLYALLGTLRWVVGDKVGAVDALKIAASLSGSPQAWYNLAVVFAEDSFAAYYALKHYFSSLTADPRCPEEIILLCKYGKKVGCLTETIIVLLDVASKSSDADTLKKLLHAVIFALVEENLGTEAKIVFNILNQSTDIKLAVANAKERLVHVVPRLPEEYKKRENEYMPPMSEAYATQTASSNHSKDASIIYSTDYGYVGRHQNSSGSENFYMTGIVIEFSPKNTSYPPTWVGRILGDDGNTYFFLGAHLLDEELNESLKNKDYSQHVGFTAFTNTRGAAQAGAIQKISTHFTSNWVKGKENPFVQNSSPREARQKAEWLVRQGKRQEAVDVLSDALNTFNNNIDINLFLAQQFSALGRYYEAAEIYSHLLKIEKRPNALKHAHIQYALLLGKAGEQQKAAEEIEKLIRDNPNDLSLKSLLDKIQQNGREGDEASDAEE